nr:hypothetical protein [Rhodococcus sp. 15-1154-1]
MIVADIGLERRRQDAKWGPDRDQPNGTGGPLSDWAADTNRRNCERAFAEGRGSWYHILAEEVGEAFAESDPASLRTELVQVAAVAMAWIDNLDRTAAQRALRTELAGVDVEKPKEFREKNPETVQALVWTGKNLGDMLDFVNNVDVARRGDQFVIDSPSGLQMHASIGDYVLRDTATGKYQVLDNVAFSDLYEPVEQP